ncbi:hypothetical protein HX071_03190 [Myroides marinus]|uniref:hypothetical protein n=1 Tax=Myroides marinus TaxID=703342 RepID=UPI0025752E98|nr:hypothetical protein [Myroides marinus]MDM1501205.1 hypothetical protein [Myroides marinus]
MLLNNLRKETSERSDENNWTKSLLLSQGSYYYESIEGCNQNNENIVKNLFERARVDIVEDGTQSLDDIRRLIIKLESTDKLIRKINFAKCFNINLQYVLYCDEVEKVFVYEFVSIDNLIINHVFNSYQEFADWIYSIKGWKSNKSFREYNDLPNFDKKLRLAGTPWPTNIDCFVTDLENNPIGIVEFQNADRVGVMNHCNNDYFLCKMTSTNQWGHTVYHDDIRRWTSQEILRVQSGLKYIIITWSQNNDDFQIKELEKIAIPHFPFKDDGKMDWDYHNRYKNAMSQYVNQNRQNNLFESICNNGKTYFIVKNNNNINSVFNDPILSLENKTFPSLYYHSKHKVENNRALLLEHFNSIINR